MKTFSAGLLLGLLACSVAVSWANECKDTCHVTCVFPSSKSCKFKNPVFQKPCLQDFEFCVASCYKLCKCKRICKDLDNGEKRKGGEFDLCVSDCFSNEIKKLSSVVTTKEPVKVAAQMKSMNRIMMKKYVPPARRALLKGKSLIGEQGHLS